MSSGTKDLLNRPLHRRVEIVDLGRSLLEDAYPLGIARRTPYPDIKTHCAKAMIDMIARKAELASPSHQRVRWLSEAFRDGPEAVMSALLKRGFIDLDNPRRSKLFEKTTFGGPMFKVFNDEDEKTMISWIASLKLGTLSAARAQPRRSDAPAPGSRVAKRRLNAKSRGGENDFNSDGPGERGPWEAGGIEP